MRLQKYIASCGIASRRAAEDLIAEGQIAVNGRIVREMGTRVGPGDVVSFCGKQIIPESRKRVVLYHKPLGEVTTASDPQGRPTVMDRFRGFPERLYPIGRLDLDSEGLLLLTNDGDLTERLSHPRYRVEKTYLVRLAGRVADEDLDLLRSGILLEGRKTAPAKLVLQRREDAFTDVSLVIREGRNRQIRRMAETIGHRVLRLTRTEYAGILLGELARGAWRDLTPEERAKLDRATEKPMLGQPGLPMEKKNLPNRRKDESTVGEGSSQNLKT